jgi:hypothetical protein
LFRRPCRRQPARSSPIIVQTASKPALSHSRQAIARPSHAGAFELDDQEMPVLEIDVLSLAGSKQQACG